MKRYTACWKKTFANYISDKLLVSKIPIYFKSLSNATIRKQPTNFTNEDIRMVHKSMKRCSASLTAVS